MQQKKFFKFIIWSLLFFNLISCGTDEEDQTLIPSASFSYLWEKSFKNCASCHHGQQAANLPVLSTKQNFLDYVDKAHDQLADNTFCDTLKFIDKSKAENSLLVITVTSLGDASSLCESRYQTHKQDGAVLSDSDKELLLQWIKNGAPDN